MSEHDNTIYPETLIISSQRNPQTQSIQEYGRKKYPHQVVHVFDLATFPTQSHCDIFMTNKSFLVIINEHATNADICLNSEKLHTIWWWEPQLPIISSQIEDPNQAKFAYMQCSKLIESLWSICDCRWINSPEILEVALNPISQIRAAQKAGFYIPDTFITSSPENFVNFAKAYKEIWYRDLLPGSQAIKVTADMFSQVSGLNFAPIMFQNLQEGKILGCIVIGNIVKFVELVFKRDGSYGWETYKDNSRAQEISIMVKKMIQMLGLLYGMVQIIQYEGQYIFFCLDLWADFVSLEKMTQLPLIEIFGDFLLGNQKNQ